MVLILQLSLGIICVCLKCIKCLWPFEYLQIGEMSLRLQSKMYTSTNVISNEQKIGLSSYSIWCQNVSENMWPVDTQFTALFWKE